MQSMTSKAGSVREYLAGLPADRRAAIQAVRKVILGSLDPGYEEGMYFGMIAYCVPHRIYPPGYHCDPKQPLPFAGLAAQKNHIAVYLMFIYGDPRQEEWFRKEWAKSGKKLDMGKSCIRFKKIEDLAIDVIGKAVARVPVKDFVARYETMLNSRGQRKKVRRRSPAPQARPAGRRRTKDQE
jgi:hypothetical protein